VGGAGREGVAKELANPIHAAGIFLEREQDADRDEVLRLQVAGLIELESPGLFFEKRLRDLDRQPGPVPGVAAHAAAVLQALQAEKGLLNHLGCGIPVLRRDTADPARVAPYVILVEKFTTANEG
jgi:hypothetical protein